MDNIFKKGDKVICVDSRDSTLLVNGREYVVLYSDENDRYIAIGTSPSEKLGEFYRYRFVLVRKYRLNNLIKEL